MGVLAKDRPKKGQLPITAPLFRKYPCQAFERLHIFPKVFAICWRNLFQDYLQTNVPTSPAGT
jgi:hypothetical protein